MSLPNTIYSALTKPPPEGVMLVDGEICITYQEAIDRIEFLAGWLALQGVEPGDRVVIQLRKCVNEILLIYAVARLGAVFVNVHPLWSGIQLRNVVESSGAKIAFVEENRTHELLGLNNLQFIGGPDSLFSMVSKGYLRNRLPIMDEPNALATIIYTSGSTGVPKGVMHSQRNLVDFGTNVATCLKNSPNDRILSVLPLSFGYGLNQLLTAVHVGATLILQKSALAADVLDAIHFYSITGVGGVPSMWKQIIEVQKYRTENFQNLRYITNAGDSLSEQMIDEIGICFPGIELVLFYGTTETLRSTYLKPEQVQEKKGAIGIAIPGVKLFVLTEDGLLGGPGDQGMLLHGGAQMMLGYWNDANSTSQKLKPYPALTGDESLLCNTEDMVKIDVDGVLWFLGRANWMIKKNGFRISLSEIEMWVNKLDVVKTCIAIQHSDRSLGDDIHLVVISKLGGTDDPQKLLKVLRRTLPNFMCPREISFWPNNEFPQTPNGKLDRIKIRELLKSKTLQYEQSDN